MVVLTATAALAVTSVIWVLWRITIWLRRGGDPVREAGVAVLFLWSLAVVELTFFPLIIIFYDWHSAENLVPFASILQLLRETAPQTAFYNIAGNLALFVPFGILLPLLFERFRALWPLVWRAGVISIAIELTQVLTRARAIDVDDVILNTTGAAVGFAVYWVIAAVAQRSEGGRELWDRLGAQPDREPLLLGVAPIGLSVAIVIPMMLSTIVAGTLGEGRGGILGYAVAELPGSEVVARTDVAEYTFVLVGEGDAGAPRLGLVGYERVLPGRYTWVQTGQMAAGGGSHYAWTITAFDPSRGESPGLFVWGTNQDEAAALVVSGNEIEETLSLEPGSAFVAGLTFDYWAQETPDGILADFEFTFLDGSGNDVSSSFSVAETS